MAMSSLLKLVAGAGLLLSVPSAAQVTEVDPNSAISYPAGSYPSAPATNDGAAELGEASPSADLPPADANAPASLTPPTGEVPRDDIFNAAEGVFGKGAEGLAGLIEKILKDQGQPVAYIAGQEAGGAFIVGLRYGSGRMRHQVEGERPVYWTGPSLGFDFGADANKVFVLVYNLYDSQDLFKRYPAAEGHAYAVGGFTASYMRRGDIVLIPVRLGVGQRLGDNAGYMHFTEKNRWLPF